MDLFPPVVAVLMADIHEFSAKMGEAGAEMEALSAKGATRMAKFMAFGKTVGPIVAASAIAVGAASVKMASDFDSAMEMVHTQAGASQQEVDSLKQKVIDLAAATGQGPTTLAEGLYHVESVGYRGAAAMSVLEQGAKLATIGNANLDETIYGLTSTMQAFGAKAQDSAHWAAFFNAVVGAGDMRMEDFNKAVGTGYFSAAQTFGVSAQSAGAALAFMTDRGAHADEAATRLRMSLALMAAPSLRAAELLKDIGLQGPEVKAATSDMTQALQKAHLTTTQLATDLKKPDGLYVALSHLQSALKASGMSAEAANALLSHAFGGGKSDATILAMLNNLDQLKGKYNAIGANQSHFGESWNATTKTMRFTAQQLVAIIQGWAIAIGNWLIPKIQTLLAWLDKHKIVLETLAILIGVVMVAALIAMAIAFVAATWEIILIVAVVAIIIGAILWLWHNWDKVWGWIVQKAQAVWHWLGQTWHAITADVHNVWSAIVNWLKGVWNHIASFFASAWHTVTDPIVKAWNWVWSVTSKVWNAIVGFFKKWWPLLLAIFMPFVFAVLALWNHFHQAVFNTVSKVWNAITGFLGKAWALIVRGAEIYWSYVYRYIVTPLENAWRFVVRIASEIWSTIRSYFSRVWSTTSYYFHAVWSTVSSALYGMWRTVSTVASGVWHTLTSAFSSVLGWLRGVGSWFYGIGRSIVQGIINGVWGMAGSLWSSLKNLASNALNAAKSALGINSPSKVFAQVVGMAIPEGVAKGVVEHQHLAIAAVHSMSGALSGAGQNYAGHIVGYSNPNLTATLVGSASAPQPIQVNVEAKVDEGVLFRTTQKQALIYQQRNSRPAFSK